MTSEDSSRPAERMTPFLMAARRGEAVIRRPRLITRIEPFEKCLKAV